MFVTTIKGLLAHKLRLALTAIAVVLGVSFVVGTYVLSDTITGFFDETFTDANKGIDISVSAGDIGGSIGEAGAFSETERLPNSVLTTVKGVDGVEVAEGLVQGFAQMIDKDGEPYGGQGPPTFGFSYGTFPPFSPLQLREGKAPEGPDDVVIDIVSAKNMGYKVGEKIRIILSGPAEEFTIVGLVGFGKADNLGGATIVSWADPVAQKVLDKGTDWDTVAVKVAAGSSVTEVLERIDDALPDRYKVQTGQAAAKEGADAINSGISIFTTGILFFAGIALFVGAFIIANTFSIIVAQRSRELALLRSLGASRAQIVGSVLLEAAIVGISASIVGLFLGLGIGAGLRSLVTAIGGGGGLPGAEAGLRPRTIIVGLSVGTLTTFLSALLPAIRGSRQPPVAALRHEAAPARATFSVRRLIIGVGASGAATAMLGYGMYGKSVPLRFAFIGLGALGLFLGISMLSPLAVRPVARIIGAPLARTGMAGVLARENSRRNPQRTSSTAAALMIGIAVVAAIATLGSSIDRSLNAILDRSVKAEVIVSNDNSGIIDPSVESIVAQNPNVDAVVPIRYNQFDLGGKKRVLIGIPPATVSRAFDLEVARGSLSELGEKGVLLHSDIASTLNKDVGESVSMGFPDGTETFVVSGIFENNQLFGANYVIALAEYERLYTEQQDAQIFVALKPGADAARVAVDLGAGLQRDFPQLTVLDQEEFAERQSSQIRSLLLVVTALLLLSIIIALLGIANTLALSVFERTREIGLLRAVGTSRRQTRRMIRYESIIIAVLGAALGIVIGLAFGAAAVGALRDEGLTELSFPIGTMISVLIMAMIAGFFAAIFPARRAANLDVLQAIAAAE